jgi:hypothetical protein
MGSAYLFEQGLQQVRHKAYWATIAAEEERNCGT